MIVQRVLIQGGGIGGLIAAAALAQRGVDVDVVEHRPAGSVLGVGLIQPLNALRVMAEIGVLDDCLAAGYQADGTQVVGPGGVVLAQMPAPPPPDGLPATGNGIQRRGLCRILLNAADKAGARLFHGTTIAAIAGGGDGDENVTVAFRGESVPSDGRYDLLVGFDGVRSATRRHLFGEKYEPQLTGFSVWRVSLPRPAELERTVFAFAGPVKATLIPLSLDDCYLALVAPESAPQHGLSEPGIVAQMQDMLTGFGGSSGCGPRRKRRPRPWPSWAAGSTCGCPPARCRRRTGRSSRSPGRCRTGRKAAASWSSTGQPSRCRARSWRASTPPSGSSPRPGPPSCW
jgi:2-polyprenyl-6-methoxyphenol hydroxylase-like FAD-dependent oxidoreductase